MRLFVLFSLTLLTAAPVATRTCMRRSLTLLFGAAALLFSAPAAFAGAESFTATEKRHRVVYRDGLRRRC